MQPKYGLCSLCGDNVRKPIIAGLCASKHYWEHRKKISLAKKAPIVTAKQFIIKPTSDLVRWYAGIMAKEKPVCWNCGSKINQYDQKTWHGSIAHILPKSLFPSVKTHPLNYLILGMYCCHGQWDSNWSNASQMIVFPLAKERFKEFEMLIISLIERRKIPFQLYDKEKITQNSTY